MVKKNRLKKGFKPKFVKFRSHLKKKKLTEAVRVADDGISVSQHDSPLRLQLHDSPMRPTHFPELPFPFYRKTLDMQPHFPELRETLSLEDGFAQTRVLKSIFDYYVSQSHECCANIRPEKARADLDLTRAKKKELWMTYSSIAPSVVSVASFVGVQRKIECSGLIIGWSSSDNEATILCSAKVLWSSKDFPPSEFHIIVRMADGTLYLAKEDNVYYYLNLLTLKIHSTVELETAYLSPVGIVEEMDVHAVGRFFYPHTLCDHSTPGKVYLDQPFFGCNELLKTTCRTFKICEGGPLIGNSGNVIGIGFHDNVGCIHLLPTTVIVKFLLLQVHSSRIVRPWFGMTVLDAAQYRPRDREHQHRDSIVVVDKAPKGFVAEKNGVRPGDFVFSLDQKRMYSVKQFLKKISGKTYEVNAIGRRARIHREKSFAVVIKRRDPHSGHDITFEPEFVSVEDKRLCSCWPGVDSIEWSRERFLSQ